MLLYSSLTWLLVLKLKSSIKRYSLWVAVSDSILLKVGLISIATNHGATRFSVQESSFCSLLGKMRNMLFQNIEHEYILV